MSKAFFASAGEKYFGGATIHAALMEMAKHHGEDPPEPDEQVVATIYEAEYLGDRNVLQEFVEKRILTYTPYFLTFHTRPYYLTKNLGQRTVRIIRTIEILYSNGDRIV